MSPFGANTSKGQNIKFGLGLTLAFDLFPIKLILTIDFSSIFKRLAKAFLFLAQVI